MKIRVEVKKNQATIEPRDPSSLYRRRPPLQIGSRQVARNFLLGNTHTHTHTMYPANGPDL